MKKEEKINYKIDSDVLKNYVEDINSIKEPMSQIKDQLNQITMPMKELSKSLNESMKLIIEASKAASKPLKPIQEEIKALILCLMQLRNYRLNIQTNKQKYLQIL